MKVVLSRRYCFVVKKPFLKSLAVGAILGVTIQYSSAQSLQREWLRTYSNPESKYNKATAIAVTPDGNIVVAGTSANPSGNLDYQLIKYSPSGEEVWRARYDFAEAEFFDDELRGMTIDPAGNVIVTGTTATVKFNAGGQRVWAVSLPGRALIATSDFVYVTGFSDTDISTAQLQNNNVDGAENWRRFVDGRAHGPDIGQAITLDDVGNVYVGGQIDDNSAAKLTIRGPAPVSYTPAGMERWIGRIQSVWPANSVQVNSIVVGTGVSTYVYGAEDGMTAFLGKFDSSGQPQWLYLNDFGKVGTKLIRDRNKGDVVGTGRIELPALPPIPEAAFVTAWADTSDSTPPPARQIWQYAGPNGGITEGADIAQDSVGNFYIAGYSANDPNSYTSAMLLAKINPTGQQLALDRYDHPNAVSTVGVAMAIDANDDVYVTGYFRNAQGGSEFLTIKYSDAPKIETGTNGMHLEFRTGAGQQYAIEGSTDFLNWQSLITNTADASGLVKFDDTNAVTVPYRFYRGKQP
jgi:hypothetical protein